MRLAISAVRRYWLNDSNIEYCHSLPMDSFYRLWALALMLFTRSTETRSVMCMWAPVRRAQTNANVPSQPYANGEREEELCRKVRLLDKRKMFGSEITVDLSHSLIHSKKPTPRTQIPDTASSAAQYTLETLNICMAHNVACWISAALSPALSFGH